MSKFDFAKAQFAPAVHKAILADKTAERVFGENYETLSESDVFDLFAQKIDPSFNRKNGKNYKYLHWASKYYLERVDAGDPILAEDLYRVFENLRDFENWSTRLNKDGQPNQIKDVQDIEHLEMIVRPYQQKRDQKKAEKEKRRIDQEKKDQILQETTVLFDGPEGKIVMPHSMLASQYWGAETKWCISARDDQNAFCGYDKRSPIVMYLPTRPKEREFGSFYRSYKFASVGKNVFDEHDKWNLTRYPETLKTLLNAAMRRGDSHLKAYLEKHGNAAHIKDPQLQKEKEQKQEEKEISAEMKPLLDELSQLNADRKYDEKKKILSNISDPQMVMELITEHGEYIENFSEAMRDDINVMIAVMNKNAYNLKYASDRLKDDFDFVFPYLGEGAFEYASPRLRSDKRMIDTALSSRIRDFEYIHPYAGYYPSKGELLKLKFNTMSARLFKRIKNWKDDKDFVRSVLEKSPRMYKYISPRLKKDVELYELTGGQEYEYAPKSIRKNLKYLREVVKYYERDFQYAPKKTRANKEVIFEILKTSETILEHVPKKYLEDRRFILDAVKINPKALKYAGRDKLFSWEYLFQDDEEIVEIVLEKDPMMLAEISGTLYGENKERWRKEIARNGHLLSRASYSLKEDEDVILSAVKANPEIISKSCRVVNRWGRQAEEWDNRHMKRMYERGAFSFLNDVEFMHDKIIKDPQVIVKAGASVQADVKCAFAAAEGDFETMKHVPAATLCDPSFDWELILLNNVRAFKYLPKEHPQYKTLAVKALKENPKYFKRFESAEARSIALSDKGAALDFLMYCKNQGEDVVKYLRHIPALRGNLAAMQDVDLAFSTLSVLSRPVEAPASKPQSLKRSA